MTDIFHYVALKWTAPSFTTYQELELPFTPSEGDNLDLIGCSGDGSVLVANYFSNTNDSFVLRWADGNPIATVIGTNALAIALSNDGTTVYGEQVIGNLTYVWPSGATSPTTLTPPGGYDQVFPPSGTAISDDGSVIYGGCGQNSGLRTEAIVKWVNTVPTAITIGPLNQFVNNCSNDGSVAVAGSDIFNSRTVAGYYFGGAFRQLASPSGGGTRYANFCNGAGTLFHGYGYDSAGRPRWIQWTNVSTITGTEGGVSVYGNANLLGFQLPVRLEAAANDADVAVGWMSNTTGIIPVRWDGLTLSNLSTIPEPVSTYGLAFAVSGDGTVICGDGVNFASTYFDSMNVPHVLPLPGTFPNSFVDVVSRDGSAIFGTAQWTEVIPNPPLGSWEFRSGTADSEAGVGQMWFDSSYVDFADPTVLAKFVNPDGTWVDLGDFGQLPTGTSPLNFLNVETSDPYNITYGYGQDGNQNSWNLDSIGNDPLTGEPYDDLVFDICGPELKLVSLYPMAAPGAEYAFRNIQGGDFPIAFSQFSLSIWCCEHVNIRLPNGIDGQSSINMALTPSSAVIQINDAANDVLFSGSFTNPGTATSEYHVMFSIDTQAQTYTLWIASDGPAVQWTTTDAAFGILGDINNVIGA